jgi:hypothetical protein
MALNRLYSLKLYTYRYTYIHTYTCFKTIYGNHKNQTVARELHALERLTGKNIVVNNFFILQIEDEIQPEAWKGCTICNPCMFAAFTNSEYYHMHLRISACLVTPSYIE